jgi:ring-1,2-phenylacetyl-CoA epoxidase subunit PaaB
MKDYRSLDPRINRFAISMEPADPVQVTGNDQLSTWEVFQQMKAGKPFEHVGIVHASEPELAFMFGKEQFSRRGPTCENMFVCASNEVWVSDYTEASENVLDEWRNATITPGPTSEDYDVFYMKKRGKHHAHVARINATSYEEALALAAQTHPAPICINAWVIKTAAIRFLDDADHDIWLTLPDKKYRDAIAYKAQDKIERYRQSQLA